MNSLPTEDAAFMAGRPKPPSSAPITGPEASVVRELAAISENFPEGSLYQYVVTAKGQHLLTYVGRGFERIFGARPAELPTDAAWLTSRIHPADRPGIDEASERSRRELTPFNVEVRITDAAGQERWVSFRAQPRRLEDGAVVWDGAVIDVTDRRRAEEAVRRQAEFLALLNQTTLELLGRRNVSELLQALVDRSTGLLHASHAEILLLDAGDLVLRAVSHGRTNADGTRLRRGETPFGWRAIDSRLPVVVAPFGDHPSARDFSSAPHINAAAIFPIVRGNECLGVLGIARAEAGASFKSEDLREGTLLAQMAALVMHNATIHEEAVRDTAGHTAALARSLAMMRATLESTADAILVVNGEGHIETYNLNFAEMWDVDLADAGGVANEEKILRTILDQLVAPELFLASVRDLYSRSEDKVFDVLHCKDGRVLERYSHPQMVGSHPIGRVWSFRDITDRRRAEAALRESEERFRMLADVSPVGIFSSDPNGKTVFVNRRWCEIAGLTEEQAMGDGWQVALHPEDRGRVATAWAEAVRVGESSAAEFRFVRPDGAVIWLVGQSRAQYHSDGRLAGYVGTITDVTNLKRADEERKKADAQSRQSRKMESLGTLAGGIAHDFNNILTGTFGFVDLARLELPADHPAVAWLDRITSSSQRARDLVRQILMFSRKNESARMPQPLHPVVGEALRLLGSSLPPTVEIVSRLDETTPQVLADYTQIHQVVLNLCTNASHAMPNGGKITVTLEACQVSEEQASATEDLKPGTWVRLSVADEGIGMDAAMLEQIFEPFFTTKGAGIGTGLGLAVVHGIVKSHEGAIVVRSIVGQGSTFELYFPPAANDLEPPPPPPPEIPQGNGEHILVVDDDSVCGFAVEKMVQSLGYHATRFAHPEMALAQFTATPDDFDLVVSDLAMPGMDGAELIGHLLDVRANLPVIAITGYMETARQRLLEKTPVRVVLRKPVSRDELARAIAQQLRRVR